MAESHSATSSSPLGSRGHGLGLGAPVPPMPGHPVGPAAQASGSAARAEAPGVASGTRGVFVPLLLVTLAVLGWEVFQMSALRTAHTSLVQTLRAQHPQVMQARRVSRALSALAGDTQRLADAGDPGARLIVAQLQKRGITIHAPEAQGGT